MPGSQTTPGPTGARNNAPADVAFRQVNNVGTRIDNDFAAQWLAYTLPYRRFADVLADACARIGGDVDCYSFTAVDFHHILLASLPAHLPTFRPGYHHIDMPHWDRPAVIECHASGLSQNHLGLTFIAFPSIWTLHVSPQPRYPLLGLLFGPHRATRIEVEAAARQLHAAGHPISELGLGVSPSEARRYDGQAEANEETASQITPQSPSEKASAAINTTRDVSCRMILRTERLRSRALR